MTMNLYVYARDNPERYTDPNGHMVANGETGGTPPPPIGPPDVRLSTNNDDQYPVATTTVSVTSTTLTTTTTQSHTSTTWTTTTVCTSYGGGQASCSSMTTTISVSYSSNGVTVSGACTGGSSVCTTFNQFLVDVAKGVAEVFGPQSVGTPMSLADAFLGPLVVFSHDFVDISQGKFTMQDAINTGLVVGGALVLAAGQPEVTFAVWALAGTMSAYGG